MSFLWWYELSQVLTAVAALGDHSVHIPLQAACNQCSHGHMARHENIFRLSWQTQGLPWHEVDTSDCYHCKSVNFALTAV